MAENLLDKLRNLKEDDGETPFIKKGWLDDITNNDIFTDNDNKYQISITDCINNCTSPRKSKLDEPISEEDLKLIFNAFSLFPLKDTKVLIIGQDPYPNTGKAIGLSFLHNIEEHPDIDYTLKNIFEAIEKNNEKYNKEYNKEYKGSPIEWAKQNNVLLLNASLTFDGDKNTLKNRINVWSEFINEIINRILGKQIPIVIILWGGCANLLKPFRDNDKDENNDNVLILRSSHPSNQGQNYCGFYENYAKKMFNLQSSPLTSIIPAFICEGVRHFKKCNDFLEKHKQTTIDWQGLVDIYNSN